MKTHTCIDCGRKRPISKLRKCLAPAHIGKMICKREFRRECNDIWFKNHPDSPRNRYIRRDEKKVLAMGI